MLSDEQVDNIAGDILRDHDRLDSQDTKHRWYLIAAVSEKISEMHKKNLSIRIMKGDDYLYRGVFDNSADEVLLSIVKEFNEIEQAGALFTILNNRFMDSPWIYVDIRESIVFLASKLTREAAATIARQLLNSEHAADRPGSRGLAAFVLKGLAPNLDDAQTAIALSVGKVRLDASETNQKARYWADAIEALVRRQPDAEYVAALVDVMKYPTAAGEPTKLLLTRLRERFPQAEELADADLGKALGWIAKTFPSIDLDSPPVRPPLRTPTGSATAPP